VRGQATLRREPSGKARDRGADGGVVRGLQVVVDEADVGEAGAQEGLDHGAKRMR
jgi:hypothetical protein